MLKQFMGHNKTRNVHTHSQFRHLVLKILYYNTQNDFTKCMWCTIFLSKGKIIPVLKNNVMKTYQGYGCKIPAIFIPELHVDKWKLHILVTSSCLKRPQYNTK